MRYQDLLDALRQRGMLAIDNNLFDLACIFPDVFFKLLLSKQKTETIEGILGQGVTFTRDELDQIIWSGYSEMLQTIIPTYIRLSYGLVCLADGEKLHLLHEICAWPLIDEDHEEAYEKFCRNISFEPTRDGRVMLDPELITRENYDGLIPWQCYQQLQTWDDIKLKQCYSSIFRPSWNYQTHRYYPLDFKAKISNLITLTMNDNNVWNLLPQELIQLIIQEFIFCLSH